MYAVAKHDPVTVFLLPGLPTVCVGCPAELGEVEDYLGTGSAAGLAGWLAGLGAGWYNMYDQT